MLESFAQVYRLRVSNVLRPLQLPPENGEPAHDAGRHALRRGPEDEAERFLRAIQVTQEQVPAGEIEVRGEQVADRPVVSVRAATEVDRLLCTKEALGALAIEMKRMA
ncbi:hypothetical protein [Streptomyces sp. NRRL B-24572]|uniref:hypothetical protein n=1 Tax=Streptomyces sp. NRRL B-24572 TaxID=1962156 RepID=UPI0015C5014D|nr:hypothetical protein [Streptomyces sp. NRRL B-24572]